MSETTKAVRYAVVTGSNKGIGFEIVRQLASNGITVVLTARDEKRGLEALEKLKEQKDISDKVIFHQLDVSDSSSVSTLAHFVKTHFGKLDILVNNAGINGYLSSPNSRVQSVDDIKQPWRHTYELAEECLQINYYGAKRMAEAFIPLLELSDAPRIVNVSSSLGKLQRIQNDWAKKVLSSDVESLTIEGVDEVLSEFLKDFKDGSLETKGRPSFVPAYTVSKAAMNAYTRILANAHRRILVNCVCPGFVKTDFTSNLGVLSTEEGAASPVRLALLPNSDEAPSGLFFDRSEVSSF